MNAYGLEEASNVWLHYSQLSKSKLRSFVEISCLVENWVMRHKKPYSPTMSEVQDSIPSVPQSPQSTSQDADSRQTQRGQLMVLNSPNSSRLPIHFPPDTVAVLNLPSHKILYGRNRVAACKANGWGFKDTYLCFLDKTTLALTGSRLDYCTQ